MYATIHTDIINMTNREVYRNLVYIGLLDGDVQNATEAVKHFVEFFLGNEKIYFLF